MVLMGVANLATMSAGRRRDAANIETSASDCMRNCLRNKAASALFVGDIAKGAGVIGALASTTTIRLVKLEALYVTDATFLSGISRMPPNVYERPLTTWTHEWVHEVEAKRPEIAAALTRIGQPFASTPTTSPGMTLSTPRLGT